MKSKRIKYLKTLQHLARKYNYMIKMIYTQPPFQPECIWIGEFCNMRTMFRNKDIMVEGNTFNEMLLKLYSKVKTIDGLIAERIAE